MIIEKFNVEIKIPEMLEHLIWQIGKLLKEERVFRWFKAFHEPCHYDLFF